MSYRNGKIRPILPFALFFAFLVGPLGVVQPLPARAATDAFIVAGDAWTYFKGEVEPPANWNTLNFDDTSWLSGPTGIGYGDGDDATVLNDMQGNYLSVYMRRTFTVADPTALVQLILKIDYDDSFVAYLNGVEVARRNLGTPGTPVPYDLTATTSHEAGVFETIDISDYLSNLVPGTNVLAIQVHNLNLGNGDLSMIPELHWVDNRPNIVRYPYLQKLSMNTVTVVWTTTEPGPSEVRYSTDLSYSNVVAATSTSKSVAAPAPYDNYYEHVAGLSNLTPDTAYNYAIYTQGERLPTDSQLHFRTHPGPNTCTFNFSAFGDTGQNWQPTRGVRDQAVARGFDLAINLGDLAYENGTYLELETRFFNVYQDILSNQMMWTVAGNHEYSTDSGAPYFDVFHLLEQALLPAENERYYSFNYANAHFVMLDTNSPLWRVSNGVLDDIADWLEADLATNNSFWTIVAMHHPWYVSDTRGHETGVRTRLVPLFEAYDVDIVLTGHDHLYERTFPIKEDALSTVLADGVVYVTNGESGGRDASYGFFDPAPDWSAARSKHDQPWDPAPVYLASYTHIYIDDGIMSLITIDDQGNVLDPVGGPDPIVIIDRSNEPGALCNTGLSNISGTVYVDNDGDGAFSVGDTPLAGVQIDLSNGQSTATDANGFYQFTNLTPGSYTITENDPSGYLSSGDAQGANDNTIVVSLQSGQAANSRNFFDYQPASISGTVYDDTDDDSAFSAGDTSLTGVRIDLSNGQSKSTTTDANGFYQFIDLLPGNYTVTQYDLPGYISVTDVQGANDNLITATLTSGDNVVERNFLDGVSSGSSQFIIYLPIISKETPTN